MQTQRGTKHERGNARQAKPSASTPPTTASATSKAGGDGPVAELMNRFADGLTAGDGKAITQLWAVPALVLSDTSTHAVSSLEQVEAFFSGAKEQYAKQGIDEARPDIRNIVWMTPNLVNVTVRWPYVDRSGREFGEESSTYTLRRLEDGSLKIQVIVMHGAKMKDH